MTSIDQRLARGEDVPALDIFVEDTIGPGAQACSIFSAEGCPNARTGGFHVTLALVPWFETWGMDYLCTCGASWSSESSAGDFDLKDARVVTNEIDAALPAGTKTVYGDETLLVAVILPDGRRIEATRPDGSPIAFSVSPFATSRVPLTNDMMTSERMQDIVVDTVESDRGVMTPWGRAAIDGTLPTRLGSVIEVDVRDQDEVTHERFEVAYSTSQSRFPSWRSRTYDCGEYQSDFLGLLDKIGVPTTFKIVKDTAK